MSSVWTKIVAGTSGKNVHVQVNGFVDGDANVDWKRIVSAKDFDSPSLRLDAINFALSDKLEVLLAWHKEGEVEPHVFLPLNGRGRLDFDGVNGLRNTVGSGKTGDILLSAYPTSEVSRRLHFTFTLDLSKQRD